MFSYASPWLCHEDLLWAWGYWFRFGTSMLSVAFLVDKFLELFPEKLIFEALYGHALGVFMVWFGPKNPNLTGSCNF